MKRSTKNKCLNRNLRISRIFYKFCLFWQILILTIGCASKQPTEFIVTEPLESFQCPAGEFQGYGVGDTESEALSVAHGELAKQVNLSVKVTVENTVNQQKFNNEENISSEYVSRTAMESSLSNAHDARIVYKKLNGNKINVTVCMSRADAAKGFLEKQRLLADSLELVFNVVLKTKHPKHKNDAWYRMQILWNEFMRVQSLLEGWGTAKMDYFNSASEIYSKTKEDYISYCRNIKAHWNDNESECSDVAFTVLSRKIKMEKSTCSSGLKFNFTCTEKCKSVSYGVECSFEPSLAIESCNGERYSLLKVPEQVTGFDRNNKNKAKENLIENFPKAEFFEKWEKEIGEWLPKCVD